MTHVDSLLLALLEETGASRVTLRQDIPGEYRFPVTHEARAPGVGSLRDERSVDLPTQPVVAELLDGRQVVQADCRKAFDDPGFQRMLTAYGGLSAQIVTPIFEEGRLAAIVSLHELKGPREWSAADVDAATRTAAEVGRLL